MKKIFTLFLFFIPAFVFSQNTGTAVKPPKIRIEPGFFVTRYELGEKTTPANEVKKHLKQHDADAYYKWKSADRAAVNSLLWSIVGLGGIIVGATSDKNDTKTWGFGIGAFGLGVSLVCDFSEKARRQKSIDIYNRKYGY